MPDAEQARPGEVTQLLRDVSAVDSPESGRLASLIYDSLHELARRHLASERRDHTLQPTALVHDAYLKLVGQDRVRWQGRAHFLNVASNAIRRILIDHARARKRQKRGGDAIRVTLADDAAKTGIRDCDLLDLDRALEELEQRDNLDHRIVMLRFFGGLRTEEIAAALEVGERTVERRWSFARAWLHRRLSRA